uniref:Uncharacterized protein n=1 Tax=Arundo donax TaxID=35708 RepID=A0A0A9AN45_ARUDO
MNHLFRGRSSYITLQLKV